MCMRAKTHYHDTLARSKVRGAKFVSIVQHEEQNRALSACTASCKRTLGEGD